MYSHTSCLIVCSTRHIEVGISHKLIMTLLFIVLWVLTLALGSVFTFVITYLGYVHHKYRHIPGPKRASFFYGNNPQFAEAARRGKSSCMVLLEWARTYGRTFVVWNYQQPLVVTVEPNAVKDLLVNGKHPKSQRKYSASSDVFGSRFMGVAFGIECDYAVWRPRRIAYNPGFSFNACKGMMDSMNSIMDYMVEYLEPMADGKTPVQLGLLFNHIALDIVTKCAFGQETSKVEDDKYKLTLYLQDVMKGVDIGLKDSVFGKFKFWSNASTKQSARTATEKIRATAEKWMDDRIKALKNQDYVPDDLMTSLARTAMTTGLSKDVAIDDILSIYTGGQETTANTVALAVMELDKYPDIVKKMQKEIDEILGNKMCINYDDLESLRVTSQTFKEVMRLYPAFPFHYRDIVTDDYKIDGYHVPKGSIVHVNAFVSQHLAEHFPDPETLKPERFDPDNEASHSPYTYFPFLIGARNCIAQKLAKVEAIMFLAKIMQRFNIQLHSTQRRGFMERTTLAPIGGLTVTLTERHQ